MKEVAMASVTDLDTALDQAGIPVTSADLLAALAHVGAQRLVHAPTPSTPLSHDEATILARHSGIQPDSGAPRRVRARATAKTATLYIDALSTSQVAEMTGRSPSRVRHLATERRLYTLPVDRRSGLLFPDWQFTESGQPLPGLAAALTALPDSLHPLQVTGFFTTPSISLSLDDETPLSPIQWLRDGGDETPVAALASIVGDIP
jgi:hypothetical protein